MGLGGIDTADGIKVGIRRCVCCYPALLQQNDTSRHNLSMVAYFKAVNCQFFVIIFAI